MIFKKILISFLLLGLFIAGASGVSAKTTKGLDTKQSKETIHWLVKLTKNNKVNPKNGFKSYKLHIENKSNEDLRNLNIEVYSNGPDLTSETKATIFRTENLKHFQKGEFIDVDDLNIPIKSNESEIVITWGHGEPKFKESFFYTTN